MTFSPPRVVVIGGGITGLAAAHRLLAIAPAARITLLEAENRLGGKIVSDRVDGFVVEGGPDSFLAAKPRGVGLSEEIGLGGRLQSVTPREKRAFVLFHDRLHELPEGLTGLVPTRLGPLARSTLLSPVGKARVALDFVLPAEKTDGDESLGGFVRRRLGREAWERLVEPLMAGIYAADGDQLSLAATFPQLRDAEKSQGGVIRGVLAARRQAPPQTSARSAFLAPVEGMGALVSLLEQRLREAGVTIVTGASATSVSWTGDGYRVRWGIDEEIAAAAVILATPAFVSADLVAGSAPLLAAELHGIPYASTAIVTVAFRTEDIRHPLDAHGYVVPRVEGSPILACTWSSRKWSHRAPDGWELVRVFVGRSGREESVALDDSALIELARKEVATRLGVDVSPAFSRVHRWPRGMPQYLLGHPERLARIEEGISSFPGLLLAGSAYRGVGIPDCIASGERAADAAAAHLERADSAVAQQPIAIGASY